MAPWLTRHQLTKQITINEKKLCNTPPLQKHFAWNFFFSFTFLCFSPRRQRHQTPWNIFWLDRTLSFFWSPKSQGLLKNVNIYRYHRTKNPRDKHDLSAYRIARLNATYISNVVKMWRQRLRQDDQNSPLYFRIEETKMLGFFY